MSTTSSEALPAKPLNASPSQDGGAAATFASIGKRAGGVAERTIVLEPGRAERNYWRDLWHYRELLAILAWRDVAVRYKQTVIGVTWAVIRPFLTMVVYTVIFGQIATLPSDGVVPYPIMVFACMLPWF